MSMPLRIPHPSYITRVADVAERDGLARKFFGLEVFVVALGQIHVYDGAAWDVVSSSGANTPDVLIDCGTITAPSENVLIDCGTIV